MRSHIQEEDEEEELRKRGGKRGRSTRSSRRTNIVFYIYRPIFGASLAVGTFIIGISLNGLISEGGIESIETNSILTLAFAAGLLSEPAYLYLTRISDRRLGSSEDESDSTGDRDQAGSPKRSEGDANGSTRASDNPDRALGDLAADSASHSTSDETAANGDGRSES